MLDSRLLDSHNLSSLNFYFMNGLFFVFIFESFHCHFAISGILFAQVVLSLNNYYFASALIIFLVRYTDICVFFVAAAPFI